MERFFLIIEVLSYLFAAYLFFKKRELAIIYVPVLIFTNNVIVPSLSASLYYGSVSALILGSIFRNITFYRNNPFAILLFGYFLLLLTRSHDLGAIRSLAFPVFWFFISIPLISTVYKKYSAETILKELGTSAVIILSLFIVNVLLATFYHYTPTRMYGIIGGILYGNIYAAGFNLLASAVFIVALRIIMSRKLVYLPVLILAYCFIMLSLRRSVMLVSSIGILVALSGLILKKETKKFITIGALVFLTGFFIYSNTGFENQFKERYELRNLDERELEGEPRFAEYELLYKDMFVYEAYSPLIGFEPFNSAGNYGKGIFEFRTLHGDLPAILHSSGLIGIILYLLMIFTVFRKAIGAAGSLIDKTIIFFGLVAFVVFTGTGRYTECASMMLIFLVVTLPLAKKEVEVTELSLDNELYEVSNN